jgi:hypothetical protein
MAFTDLRNPFLDDGIRTTNFFNGRILYSEDLRREQDANQTAHELFGQAAGEGVVYGLEVSAELGGNSATAPVVTVQPGLAFNRNGHALTLANPLQIRLSTPINAAASGPTGNFGNCTALPAGVNIAGKGVYVLLMSPVEGREGRASASGLGNVDANCNAKALVDGVRFCIIRIDPPLLNPAEIFNEAQLRNVVAYKCFGYGVDGVKPPLQAFAENPFGDNPRGEGPWQYGIMDALRVPPVTGDQIPLAVIYWDTGFGTKFIDNWSVRRRPNPVLAAERWPMIAGDRRVAEAEAMIRQFGDQVRDIYSQETALDAIVGQTRFQYLPPAGIIPVKGVAKGGRPSPKGFDPLRFFGDRIGGVVTVDDIEPTDGNRLRALMAEALYHEPINLGQADTPQAPGKIQLYRIWENIKAVEAGDTNQLAVVFVNSTLPYAGVARFGYSHFTRSYFAPRVL